MYELIGAGCIILAIYVLAYITKKYIDGLVKQSLDQFSEFQNNMNHNDQVINDTIAQALARIVAVLNPPKAL